MTPFSFIGRISTTLNTGDRFKRHAFDYVPNPARRGEVHGRKGERARIKPLPKAAQKLWVKAYDRALERFKQKGTAAAIAWARVKRECYKDSDRLWQCPELMKRLDREKRIKKLHKERKKAEKAEKEISVEVGDVSDRMRAPTKAKKPTEEEAMHMVRRLRM